MIHSGGRDQAIVLLILFFFFFLRPFDVKRTKRKATQHDQNENHLLWIPKRGKTPPNVERAKLFAARELAAKTGYASTKNVKMPEYTRMVLSNTEFVSVNDLRSQVCSRNQDIRETILLALC